MPPPYKVSSDQTNLRLFPSAPSPLYHPLGGSSLPHAEVMEYAPSMAASAYLSQGVPHPGLDSYARDPFWHAGAPFMPDYGFP